MGIKSCRMDGNILHLVVQVPSTTIAGNLGLSNVAEEPPTGGCYAELVAELPKNLNRAVTLLKRRLPLEHMGGWEPFIDDGILGWRKVKPEPIPDDILKQIEALP